jgi:DNA-binding NarL/FixJ family response regulator
MRSLKIVIVDRNDITRKGMQAIVGDAGTPYEVAAAFTHLREACQYLYDYPVDLMIVDDTTLHPIEIVRMVTRCYERHPGLGLIILSQRRDGDYIQQVTRHGSAAYILKNGDLAGPLLTATRMMGDNKYPFLSPEAVKLLGTRRDGKLDHRDLEVLRLLERELSVKEICQQMDLSDKTIYRVRRKLKRVLGVRNNESIVDAARKKGLLDRKDGAGAPDES